MLIKSEYDIQFHLAMPTPMVRCCICIRRSNRRCGRVNQLKVEHIDRDTKTDVATSDFRDVFGNRCTRFTTPAGAIRLSGMNVLEMEAKPDPINAYAQQATVENLPSEVLQFFTAQPVLRGRTGCTEPVSNPASSSKEVLCDRYKPVYLAVPAGQ